MKLNLPKLQFEEKLIEFDNWVTPSITEVKDTAKFQNEYASIVQAVESIGSDIENFTEIKTIAIAILKKIDQKNTDAQKKYLSNMFSLFFIVTGKSDNNSKCQFPLYLIDQLGSNTWPKVKTNDGVTELFYDVMPRVISDESLVKQIIVLNKYPEIREQLLNHYITFLLNEENYQNALKAFVHNFFEMKKREMVSEFLLPLIVYRVRGSVSASGGHEPEDRLRERMKEWGLKIGQDFNEMDVIIDNGNKSKKIKTRAYDFILPYKVPTWQQKIFIQCQFYAGDSGSVSHKNVDQLRTSRDLTIKQDPKALFIEYVDGAGYYGSLFGDLKKILHMEDTYDFFQVRTSVLKLRNIIQEIGFLTPMEIIHAWSITQGSLRQTIDYLQFDGYKKKEIKRCISDSVEKGILTINDDRIEVIQDYLIYARRYLLLDYIAKEGEHYSMPFPKNILFVPGLKHIHGIEVAKLSTHAIPNLGLIGEQWAKNGLILQDLDYLLKIGWISKT